MDQAQSHQTGTWRDALLPFLVVGTALSIYGAYLLRSNPDIAPWLGGYLVLLWIGLLLWIPTIEPKGQPPRKSLRVLLHIVLATFGTASFDVIALLFGRKNPILLGSLFIILFIGFLSMLMLLWQRKQERNLLDRMADKWFGSVALFSIWAVIVAVLTLGIYKLEQDAIAGPKFGPSTPWAVQLALVQREALRKDKDALLISYSVGANPVERNRRDLTPDSTLQVDFEFITHKDRFDVVFNDNSPTSTLHIRDNIGSFDEDHFSHALQKQSRTQSALAQVKISPREAWQKTWQQAVSHAQTRKLPIRPSIILDLRDIGSESGPSMWHVTYWPVPENTDDPFAGLGDVFNMNYTSQFDVDAQTEAILTREFKHESGQTTSTADPSACNVDCSLNTRRLQSCTLQDLVAIYGPPQKIRVSESGTEDSNLLPVQFFYPTKGLDFYVTPPKGLSNFEPAPDMVVISYQCYMPTDLQSHIEQEASTGISVLTDWPGFQP